MSAWEWPDSTIVQIIDGDTIDAVVTRDLGFGGRVQFPVRLRLNRINTPAKSSRTGKAATARVVAALASGPVHITTVQPYKYSGPPTAVGEYMAEVTLAAGVNLSDLLVTERLAVYWDGTGPRPADT